MRTPISRGEHISAKTHDPIAVIIEAAKKEVDKALEAEYRPDPMFRPEISKAMSFASGCIIRHGRLIELAAAEALRMGGLTVLRNVKVPVTSEALGLVTSDKYSQLVGQQIDFNIASTVDFVDADLLVIDEMSRWAASGSCKRGNGQTETRKRKDGAKQLRAVGFTLASWLRQQGYRVDVGTVAVIDYYGQAGFPADMTLKRQDIDGFFGLPIVKVIDATTRAMHEAADAAMGTLLESVVKVMPPAPIFEGSAPIEIKGQPVPRSLLRPRVCRPDVTQSDVSDDDTKSPRH